MEHIAESNNTNNQNTQNNTQQGNMKDLIIDPYTAQLLIMRSEMYIVYNYPNLVSINQKLITENFSENIPDDSAIYIIKSFTEEDIHKSIKYNVWSSTNFGNTKLNSEFKARPVFLLFSAYKTNQFTGLARMKSEVNFKNVFPLWARDNWRGTFEVEWLLVKDVPFREFRNVKCEQREKKVNGEYNFINYSTKSLTNSPDCQKLCTAEGKEIVNIMVNYQNRNSILEHFEYYDTRQANYERTLSLKSGKSSQGSGYGYGYSNSVGSHNDQYSGNYGYQNNVTDSEDKQIIA
jgi:hypothetical protein